MGKTRPVITDWSRRPPADLQPGNYHVEVMCISYNGRQVLRICDGPGQNCFVIGARIQPPSMDETLH